jgi:hypothetical protein
VRRTPEIEHERHTCVAKVMKAHGGEARLGTYHRPAPAEIVRFHRRAAAGREDQAVIFPVRPGIGPLMKLSALVLPKGVHA